nr:LPXTG cell wall anchor domain-containing protein [Hespellia stercorisuis]
MKKVPETPTPEKPDTPESSTPTKTSNAPKTGDTTNILGFLALLATSGGGLGLAYFLKRRKSKNV